MYFEIKSSANVPERSISLIRKAVSDCGIFNKIYWDISLVTVAILLGRRKVDIFSERNNKFKTLFTFFLQKVGFCKTTPDLSNRKLYLP